MTWQHNAHGDVAIALVEESHKASKPFTIITFAFDFEPHRRMSSSSE